MPDWINPWRFHSSRAVGVTSPAVDRVGGVYDRSQDNDENNGETIESSKEIINTKAAAAVAMLCGVTVVLASFELSELIERWWLLVE